MNYAIDFDTRTVESKCEDGEKIASYILENGLNLAVALIDSADELALQFTIEEMQGIYHNIDPLEFPEKKDFQSEEQAASVIWSTLDKYRDEFPNFTPALAKKLLKAAGSRNKDTTSTTKPSSKPTGNVKPRKRVSNSSTFILGSSEPKAGTLHHIITSFIDDNMGEATYDEIAEYFAAENDCDIKKAKGYISGCVKRGYIAEDDL